MNETSMAGLFLVALPLGLLGLLKIMTPESLARCTLPSPTKIWLLISISSKRIFPYLILTLLYLLDRFVKHIEWIEHSSPCRVRIPINHALNLSMCGRHFLAGRPHHLEDVCVPSVGSSLRVVSIWIGKP